MTKHIVLTFDLEEFDLPEEYSIAIEKKQQLQISTDGLENLLVILRKHSIRATFFTTAFYAENNQELMSVLVAEGHEIASHLYYHSDYNPEHVALSKLKLEEITGQPVYGFRSPRLRPIESGLITKAGYEYESSLNPTYIPGRYINFFKSRRFYFDQKSRLFVLPFSVSPIVRFPLFWLSFKNISFGMYRFLCLSALKKDKYLHLYYHPWEFADLNDTGIPKYIRKIDGNDLANRLDKLIETLIKKGKFTTIHQFFTDVNHKK